MNIIVVYRLEDNVITSIAEVIEGSISHFDPETYGSIQGKYASVRLQVIAIGLNIQQVDEWVLNNSNIANQTAADLKKADIRFGEGLLLEFLTGQKDIALDNTTYRAVSEIFKYAESALRRGDIPQAKTELTAIAPSDPVWTQETKDYFIGKINIYLGI